MPSAPHFRSALQMQPMLLEYRVEQVLGAGGFGITYRARDTNLDKDVAQAKRALLERRQNKTAN